MCGTKIVHWLKILPFLSGLKTYLLGGFQGSCDTLNLWENGLRRSRVTCTAFQAVINVIG